MFHTSLITKTILRLAVITLLLQGCSSGDSNTAISQTSAPLLSIVMSYDTYGQSRDVLIDDPYVYVADGTVGLLILKSTSYGALVLVKSYSIPDRAYSLQKGGDYLYVASRSNGVNILDVSDPANPVAVSNIPTQGRASYIQLLDNILYVCADDHFIAVDVSDPAQPGVMDDLATDSGNQHLVIDGDYAYVAAYNLGFRIIDISSPSALSQVSETSVSKTIVSIAKKNNYVYFGGDDSNLFVYNVSSVAAPAKIIEMLLPDTISDPDITELSPHDITVWKDFLFIADGDMGVQILNISNPASPVIETGMPTPGSAQSLNIVGNTMAIADEFSGVHLTNIFETTDIDGDGVLDGDDAFPQDATESVDTDGDGIGDNADTDDDGDGVSDANDAFPLDANESSDIDGDGVGDNSDVFPSDPNESLDSDLDGIGDNADADNQVVLTPVSNLIDSIAPASFFGQARGVHIEDGTAIIAEGTSGLGFYTIDANGTFIEQSARRYDPTPPDSEDRSARTFYKNGNYIYLAKRLDGLHVLDISNPNSTTMVTSFPMPRSLSKATFIRVVDNTLFLSIRDGVMIFDISSPGNPVLLSEYKAPNEFEHILVEDGIAYIAAYYSGIFLMDVTDLSNPIKISVQTIPNPNALPGESSNFATWAVEKKGDFLYTGGESSGLHVFDVSNPLLPLHIADIPLPSSANLLTTADQPPFHMEAIGNNLFIADGSTGIIVADISDPYNPSVITNYVFAGATVDYIAQEFHINNYTIVIGNYKDGAEIVNLGSNLDHDSDATPNHLDNYPLDNSRQ